MFASPTLYSSLLNTVVICVVTLAFMVLIASMAGYQIARNKQPLFRAAFAIFVATLIIPTQTNMVTLFRLGIAINLINTMPFMILIYLASNAGYSAMIYSAFTKTISLEIEESAMIDGCGKFRSFFSIVFPLLLPASGTVIVTEMFWYWNDFQGPLIYLSGADFKTMMLEVYNFKNSIGTTSFTSTQWGPVTTVCLISILPILVFFLFTQKHLIRGLNVGGIKG